jgi:hypothetical protein
MFENVLNTFQNKNFGFRLLPCRFVLKQMIKMRRKDSVSYTLCACYKRKKLLFKILNICFK